MLPEVDQIVRVMRAARMTREEAEAELAREAEAARKFDMLFIGSADVRAEIEAIVTVENTDAILDDAGKSCASGGRGGKKRAVTVDMEAYERAQSLLDRRAVERRQSREYREALRSRLRRLDKASRPLHAPAVKSPLERYIDALERN